MYNNIFPEACFFIKKNQKLKSLSGFRIKYKYYCYVKTKYRFISNFLLLHYIHFKILSARTKKKFLVKTFFSFLFRKLQVHINYAWVIISIIIQLCKTWQITCDMNLLFSQFIFFFWIPAARYFGSKWLFSHFRLTICYLLYLGVPVLKVVWLFLSNLLHWFFDYLRF